MQPCLHPGTLRTGLPLDDFVRAAGEAGFPFIETAARRMMEYGGGDEGALRSLLDEHGVTPVHCGWSAGLRSTRADFEAALPRAEEEMAFGARFGCRGGTLVLPFRHEPNVPDPEETETRDRIARIADLAARQGQDVVLEFVGLHIPGAPPHTYHDMPAALSLAERAGRSNVGILVDSYHWHLSRGTADDLAAIPPGMPIFVHINDAPPGDVAALDDSMRVLPGAGVVDLDGFLGALAARGYDGAVSIEIFNEQLRAMPPVEAARLAYDATAGTIRSAAARPAG